MGESIQSTMGEICIKDRTRYAGEKLRVTAFPTRLHVPPAKTDQPAHLAQADQSLRCPCKDALDHCQREPCED